MLAASDGEAWPLFVGKNRSAKPLVAVDSNFVDKELGTVPLMSGDVALYQSVLHRQRRLESNQTAGLPTFSCAGSTQSDHMQNRRLTDLRSQMRIAGHEPHLTCGFQLWTSL